MPPVFFIPINTSPCPNMATQTKVGVLGCGLYVIARECELNGTMNINDKMMAQKTELKKFVLFNFTCSNMIKGIKIYQYKMYIIYLLKHCNEMIRTFFFT